MDNKRILNYSIYAAFERFECLCYCVYTQSVAYAIRVFIHNQYYSAINKRHSVKYQY